MNYIQRIHDLLVEATIWKSTLEQHPKYPNKRLRPALTGSPDKPAYAFSGTTNKTIRSSEDPTVQAEYAASTQRRAEQGLPPLASPEDRIKALFADRVRRPRPGGSTELYGKGDLAYTQQVRRIQTRGHRK
jgi:hypothetical protein